MFTHVVNVAPTENHSRNSEDNGMLSLFTDSVNATRKQKEVLWGQQGGVPQINNLASCAQCLSESTEEAWAAPTKSQPVR